ncbi:hypothetical protein LX16_4748 [Stackebrandtia albiflava]|uniref:Antitoxin FitA-like ribbon-helix-helix domain-containing protein n=1 Tax=Stackebrandtia albiflava TaxID=406432 RepID=A0A562UQR2_9ACTN|nr:hypothetical protein [Stackebrandtia albiflava]TWJ07965.1 hypothetical protein LX16_4748 [Stackebrandtia albiflava]
MTVSITIRHVPESVRNELAARAAKNGRSLQEFLLHELSDLAARPPLDEVVARTRRRVSDLGSRVTPDHILDFRDADRR